MAADHENQLLKFHSNYGSLERNNERFHDVSEQLIQCSRDNETLASQAVSLPHRPNVLKDLKNLIFNKKTKPVSGALIDVILTGLPSCGKSTLICKLLENNVISCPRCSSNGNGGRETATAIGEKKNGRGLSLYELTVVGDSESKHFHWVSNTKYTCYTFCFLSAILNLDPEESVDHDEESQFTELELESHHFEDPVLESHFQELYQRLVRITDLDFANIPYDLIKNGLTLVNIWDVGLNVVVFHMLPLLVGMLDRSFPGLVMSLDRDFWHLNDDVDVSMYGKERDDLDIILDQQSRESFLYQFARLAQGRPGNKRRENVCKVVLLTERPFDECTNTIEEIMKKRITETAAKYGVGDLVSTDVIICNVHDQRSLYKFRCSIEMSALDKVKDTRIKFPLSWVFLRSALYKTGRIYIEKKYFLKLAQECKIEADEAEKFLYAFAGDGSVIYIPEGRIEVFKKYIVLNPFDFFRKLDELFYPHLSGDLTFGLVTESSLYRIFGVPVGGDNLDFFKCMLTSCYFAFEVDSSRIFYDSNKNFPMPTIEQCFCLPAIRKQLSKTVGNAKNSFLIVPNPFFPPGAVRVMVAKYLYENITELCLITSKYYDIIEFSHKSRPISFKLVVHGSMLEFRFERPVSEVADDMFAESKTLLELISEALHFSMTCLPCFCDQPVPTMDSCFQYAVICSDNVGKKGIKYHTLDNSEDEIGSSCNCSTQNFDLDWHKKAANRLLTH